MDKERVIWSAPGVAFDPFKDAQEEYMAKAWNKRRETRATEAPALGQAEGFSKLDLHALVETERQRA